MNGTPLPVEIERRRRQSGVTPAELCRVALVSPSTYWRMVKRGKVGDITLRRLGQALELIEGRAKEET